MYTIIFFTFRKKSRSLTVFFPDGAVFLFFEREEWDVPVSGRKLPRA
jgi:hypothetical protein